jgi:ligand-binding sensor domain-containing protein
MNRILNLILMNLFLVIGLSLSAKDSFDAVSRIVSPLLTDSIKDYDPYFVESDVMISKFGPTSISRNMVQACDGSVWIACWQGIIQFDGEKYINHTLKEGLKKFHVFSVREDRSGNIWFGTIDGGLYQYDGECFYHYSSEDGLGSNSINEIYEDSAGVLWFCTTGGVSKLEKGRFTNYNKKDGLCSDDVNTIVETSPGSYWIGTRDKACSFDGQQFKELDHPSSSNGFVNIRCMIQSRDGRILLAGNDGLWAFDGDTFYQIHQPFTGYIYETDAKQLYISAVDEVTGMWNVLRFSSDKKKAAVTMEQVVPPLFSMGNMYFGICALSDGSMLFGNLKGIIKLKAEKLEIL